MADDAVRQPRASDAEVEAYLARLRASSEQPGPWNLATLTGLLLVAAGVAYLAQQMGMPIGWDLSWLMRLLPILGGVLIILLGLGVLSRPRRSPNRFQTDLPLRRLRNPLRSVWSAPDKARSPGYARDWLSTSGWIPPWCACCLWCSRSFSGDRE